jgi:3-oxoacyl-[acyl-carrier protein] reductase
MDLGLKDKVAVVSAASRGLGRAAANALAAEGAKLAICSRDAEKIHETGEVLREKHGVEVLALACDVTSPKSIEDFARRVLETYDTVHVLFTNAGGPPPGRTPDLTPADYDTAVQLNLMSTVHLVYAFLHKMNEQQWGRIIASTSITVKQPIPALALSNVSRAGVIGFVKSLSTDLGPLRITANAVAPGYIMTERVEQILENQAKNQGITYEEALQTVVGQIPTGRVGTPREFGALVAFLASEQAAFINGETILVDGGMYRGLH